jgi:hypothetical protein
VNGNTDQLSWYSNYGSCVNILAPGGAGDGNYLHDIASAGISSSNSVAYMSGTSMASPLVAGVVANYLSTKPNSTYSQTLNWLLSNSRNGKVTNLPPSTINKLVGILPTSLQTTLKISNTIKRAGAGTTFALTTSGGLGDGLISFAATGTGCSTSSANLTSTQVGTCSVVATKAAQGIYSAISSSPLVFTFTAATQSALVISNATLTNIASTPVTLTTTGGSGEGAITYKASGSGCAISTTTLTATRPTTCSVTATKAAHGIYKAASSAVVRFIFTLAPQESLSISNSPTSANAGTPIALTTTGGSGAGAVKFTLTPSAGCRLSGTTLNTTAPATCTLTATKAANGVYAAATSAPVTFTFSAVPQSTLTISNAITSAQKGKKITLTTTGGSGTGKVTYTLISGSCTISGSTLTSTTATTCSISATKAAAGIYSAGSSGAKEFTFTN